MIDESNSWQQVPKSQQQVKKMLVSSFETLAKKSPSNQEIAIAHEQIGLTMKRSDFLASVTAIVLERQNQNSDKAFMSQIATTANTYMRHQQSRSELVLRKDRRELNKELVQVYTNSSIHLTMRQALMKRYPQFIYSPGMEIVREETVRGLCSLLAQGTEAIATKSDQPDFLQSRQMACLLILFPLAHTLVKGPLQSSLMKSLTRQFLKPSLISAIKLVDLLQTAIDTSNEQLFTDIVAFAPKLVEFLKDLILHASHSSHLHYIQEQIHREPRVSQLLISCFCLSVKSKKGRAIGQVMIDHTVGAPILSNLNSMKKYCMDIVVIFAKEILSAQVKYSQNLPHTYSHLIEVMSFMIKNMIEPFVRQIQVLQYPKNSLHHAPFCKSFINCLSSIIRINIFYQESLALRDILIYSLCLPILTPPQASTVTSAADFIGRREDQLNTHSMDTIQNAASKLVEAYCDKIDGTISQLSDNMVNTIYFQLSANPNFIKQLPQQLISSYFFTEVDYLDQIECALTILALISYTAPGRKDIIALVEGFFQSKSQFVLRDDLPGTLKSAILLCYTYYVDDFYSLLAERKGTDRQFHLKLMEQCCVMIKRHTQNTLNSSSKQERLQIEIAALQALDCLNNCITQKHLLAALFRTDQQWTEGQVETIFLNFFSFFLFQVQYCLNVGVMDVLLQFMLQSMKNIYVNGYATRRHHYDCRKMPSVIRKQLCELMGQELVKLYLREDIPNHILMKAKIMNLMEYIVTLCDNPDSIITQAFFSLKSPPNHEWDFAKTIEIYLRRVIQMTNKGKQYKSGAFEPVLAYFLHQFQEVALKEGDLKELLGIGINLMMIEKQHVTGLIDPLGNALVILIRQEAESSKYVQKLDYLIKQIAYLLMVGMELSFNENNRRQWGQFVTTVKEYYSEQSSKGFICFTSSNPYIGKVLTLCLKYLYNNRVLVTPNELSFLFNNILHDQYVYRSQTQKMLVAGTLIQLLNQKQSIAPADSQCLNSFNMVSNLFHSFCSTLKVKEADQEFEDSSEVESDIDGSDQKLNYREYSLDDNQFTLKQSKEDSLQALKSLCHKLKQQSPEFLKTSIELLSHPVRAFIKQKVFFFEGSINDKGLRKIVKVKQ